MVLNIQISPEAEAVLKSKADAAGIDVSAYAARHLELMANPQRSLHALSGEAASVFTESGMTEDELSEFLEAEKHQMRAERRTKKLS